MSGKKSKQERRSHRKQKQEEPKRTPNLARVGDALTSAILETPHADPRPEAFELHPEFTREQIILAGACYYYAGAGSVLMMARALDRNLPSAYSLVAGMVKMRATDQEGESFDLTVGFDDGYDPLRVERGDVHAWIQLHDGPDGHLIDFTSRGWPFHAAVHNLIPASYPDFVHLVNPIGKLVSFGNSPYIYQVNSALTEHMRTRLHTEEGVDPAVIDIALRAARFLDWDTDKLNKLPVRQSSSIDIPVMRILTPKQ